MRLNYYRFPEDTSEEVLLAHGCEIVLKNGHKTVKDHIPEEHREEVDYIDTLVGPTSVSYVKKLLKEYGGYGYTEHYERDGGLFDVTTIQLNGNNSKFKYNHHL